ncbi:hypothetical protein [Palaeococcus sp. (in: euryarchaeotes)]
MLEVTSDENGNVGKIGEEKGFLKNKVLYGRVKTNLRLSLHCGHYG